MTPALAIFLIVVSPAVGSFLAVLADRLPRGEDVILARSACRECAAPVAPGDLVPLLSFLRLRGRCRACGAAIPAMLPLMEAGAAFAAIAVVMVARSNSEMVLGCIYMWTLLALLGCDAIWFRLPDILSAVLLLAALALAWTDPPDRIGPALLAAAVGSGAFLCIRLLYRRFRGREGMGRGDVKLMAGIGAGTGLALLPWLLLAAAAGAIGWACLRTLPRRAALAGDTALPFGSFLCAAAALVWVLARVG